MEFGPLSLFFTQPFFFFFKSRFKGYMTAFGGWNGEGATKLPPNLCESARRETNANVVTGKPDSKRL
jgi:hypothetical protein